MMHEFKGSNATRIWIHILFRAGFAMYPHKIGLFLVFHCYRELCAMQIQRRNKSFHWAGLGTELRYPDFDENRLALASPIDSVIGWELCFKVSMLKISSLAVDFHWAITDKKAVLFHEHIKTCNESSRFAPCLRYRSQEHVTDYSLKILSHMCCSFRFTFQDPLLTKTLG
jgi:hypothetical protein